FLCFFFSSRRRHTRFSRDWSSDVCSSDLTLIIDNYDSFTHNLVQYLAEGGAEPVVVRNDEVAWTPGLLRSFDNVVISPGPGTPENPGDFGVCADVIAHARIPLLGVCLGHQGICHVFGGRVRPAPHVRHG